MHIPQVIRNIPIHLQQCWQKGRNAVYSVATSIFGSDIVKTAIMPWYERTIRPLNRTDYLSLITAVALSSLILTWAGKKYGAAALPLALCAGGVIIGGWFLFSGKRVQRYHEDKVKLHLDLMIKAVDDLTHKKPDFTPLMKIRTDLGKPELQHLTKDLFKEIDEQMRQFRKEIASSNYEDKRDIVKAHIGSLISKVQANPQDKTVLDELQSIIDRVGTDKQDLGETEKHKQKLKDLQTPQALADAPELIQQINEMMKAAQGPDFSKTKTAFQEYLKGMRQRLAK